MKTENIKYQYSGYREDDMVCHGFVYAENECQAREKLIKDGVYDVHVWLADEDDEELVDLDDNGIPMNECSSCGSTENEIVIGFDICSDCWMDEACQ